MAEIDFNAMRGSGGHDAPPSPKTILNWAGGLVSLTLMAGLVTWGYQVVMRDVSGVPVIRALEGPMRIAPDDPGGRQAEHQGLAVNRVAALGEAGPPADMLQLAPAPVDLAGDDRPVIAPPPAEAAAYAAADEAAPILASVGGAATPVPDADGGALFEGDDLSAAAGPAAETLAADDVEGATEAALPLPAGALRQSPRPRTRPQEDFAARAAIAAARAAMTAPVATEIAAESVAVGTALVQLGAFDSGDEARAVWDSLASQRRFSGFFTDKTRVIQTVDRGGKTFFRLRASGFADMAAARRFCAAVSAEGADCIPVVAR
ncbi:SPOR domain-containing protein [Rhodovulum visakhapatnamense]|uniref:Sporulation related protein n=1 Tax=Rhodovulum visakhapatnamense TaxID=364297 RepID=A0A4R8GAU1_9RHOB|nr:SPOR domain-containing protein [Rhodovulum visakhapatnamense]TDX33926.1 sporulation related protein [Rhodovulum visakhapatnamense]